MNYTPYHIHTMYSNGTTNIDSVTDYKDYIDKAVELGMIAFGFSEHGNIFSWLHKKEYIESKGLKYIHAVEAYLTETLEEKKKDNYHCILIAKNYEGVKEINRLVSASYNRTDNHFYYSPRISFDELFSTSDNIIVTTACLGGVLNEGSPMAKERFIAFLADNKDRCFLEIQHHNCEEQANYNKMLYELSKTIGAPLIVGTDAHAINEEHLKGRSLLQKAKDVKFANEDDFDMVFHTYEELIEAYKRQGALPIDIVEEALGNTNKMADMVETFEVDRSAKYPKLYENSEEVFKQKINEGYVSRGIYKLPNAQEYIDRIRYEFDVYKHNGAIDFMLLEENYKKAMREAGVKYGYSRGSVSGSLIAYLLYITEIDSIKYNLNFERFMNKERISLADVDTDWYSIDRETVKQYLYHKEGLYCCDIITFNTIALKGAIDDVCRGLYKRGEEDKTYLAIAKDIKTLAESNEEEARKKYKEVFEYVDIVNGVIVSIGNHPAGCVVSPFPVDEWFGTCTTSTNQYPISTLNMKEIDSLNFVKLDILGLDNIGLIYKTCELANIPFATPDNIPSDDVQVWKSIRDDTTLIFQWESDYASTLLKSLFSQETISKIKKANSNFSYIDLFSMGNGAIRPAGDSYRENLSHGIYKDNGCKPLNDFLAPTLGYLVYQEQVIEFLHKFCGYTMGEADVVRRAFSKKTGTEKHIPEIEKGFCETMLKDYNMPIEQSSKIVKDFLQVIEDASNYLFSKNHSDPYSWIGYICGYLRYYYPLEFLTSALNIWEQDQAKSADIIAYAKQRGIKVEGIQFRHSHSQYTFDKESNTIYKGVASIKYLNGQVADELLTLADNHYDSFAELLRDISELKINSKQLAILINLGFFKEFGDTNKLLKINSIFGVLYNKSAGLNTLSGIGIKMDDYRPYIIKSNARSATIDVVEMLKHIDVEYEPRNVKQDVNAMVEYLGYIDIADPQYDKMLAVLDIDTKYTPKMKVHALKTGKTLEVKISKPIYNQTPVKKGDIIKVLAQEIKPKTKRDYSGNWIATNEKEIFITKYIIL